jgi:hypothetical protein
MSASVSQRRRLSNLQESRFAVVSTKHRGVIAFHCREDQAWKDARSWQRQWGGRVIVLSWPYGYARNFDMKPPRRGA